MREVSVSDWSTPGPGPRNVVQRLRRFAVHPRSNFDQRVERKLMTSSKAHLDVFETKPPSLSISKRIYVHEAEARRRPEERAPWRQDSVTASVG